MNSECKKFRERYEGFRRNGKNELASKQLKLVKICEESYRKGNNAVTTLRKQREDLVKAVKTYKRFRKN